MLRTPLVTASTVLLLALTGCGSDSDGSKASKGSSDSSSSEKKDETAPATGTKIEGTGYSFNAPEGWDVPPNANGAQADSFAGDLTDQDGFADNVNVALSPSGAVTPEQIETVGVKELESVGASDVTVGERAEIAGSESAHLSASMKVGEISYVVDQYYLTRDDQTYVVTFSFSPDVSAADRATITDPTLASWTWSD